MGGPKPVTCESESEGDDVATELPPQSIESPKKKAQSSSSTVNARQERPAETRKHSSRGSDSGYSTGTKGSADTAGVRRVPSAREPPSVPPPELVAPNSSRSNRPGDHRISSSHSNGSQRSAHSSQAPSRAPSIKSRSAKSEGRIDVSQLRDPLDTIAQEQYQQRNAEGLHRTASQRAARTSPPSSRAPRAQSRASQEMPPPPLPRPRSISANRAPRPSSFHAGMGIPYDAHYAAYGSPYGSYEREYPYGPPPARSAYVDKGAMGYPVRPPLSVLPHASAGYHDPMALQRASYDRGQMAAHRTQTEYSTASTASQYSARRPVSYFPDQPGVRDASPARPRDQAQPPPSPLRERKQISARQPSASAAYDEPFFDHDVSGSEDGSVEDDDDFEAGGKYMPTQQQPSQRSFNGHLSARGLPGPSMITGYGTSPHRELADPYLDDGMSDYRSSVRSKDSAGSRSTQSRRMSIASSDRGTKATSYSASSGSGGYASQRRISAYEQFQTAPIDPVADAEQYMRRTDAQANHVRQQQPQVTQESLRQHNARAIEAKRSSRPSASATSSSRVSGSYRSRTITAGEEQTIRLNIDTSAGVNVELEGDTEGRPIKWVQKPGETKAQLIIGSNGREQTVYNGSSGRTNGEPSRVSGRTGSTRGAVSGRRERARTET